MKAGMLVLTVGLILIFPLVGHSKGPGPKGLADIIYKGIKLKIETCAIIRDSENETVIGPYFRASDVITGDEKAGFYIFKGIYDQSITCRQVTDTVVFADSMELDEENNRLIITRSPNFMYYKGQHAVAYIDLSSWNLTSETPEVLACRPEGACGTGDPEKNGKKRAPSAWADEIQMSEYYGTLAFHQGNTFKLSKKGKEKLHLEIKAADGVVLNSLEIATHEPVYAQMILNLDKGLLIIQQSSRKGGRVLASLELSTLVFTPAPEGACGLVSPVKIDDTPPPALDERVLRYSAATATVRRSK